MIEQINEVVSYLQDHGVIAPEAGIVLGTGLSALALEISVEQVLDYNSIPGFVLSTVESHSGKLIYGELAGKKVVALNGRFHFYEGYSMQEVTFPIRVLKQLGIKYLLLSNASGGLNKKFHKGELMLITDHINLLPSNPLIGKNDDRLGTRFPDMSQPYHHGLNKWIENAAGALQIPLHKGTYAAVAGPNLETRTEYRFSKIIGADVVGMSTVPEVIVANHMNLPCAAISVITDECDPDNLHPVSIEEIIETAKIAEVDLTRLFKKVIADFETI